MSIERTLQALETVQSRLEFDILRDEKALAEYQLQSEKPFEHEARLQGLLAQQARLNSALDLDKDDRQAIVAVTATRKMEQDDKMVSDPETLVRNDKCTRKILAAFSAKL